MIELPRKFALLDVGARDGLQWPWRDIANLLDVTLVEPDPEEAKRLSRHAKVIDSALWSKPAELALNLTKSPGASSVFRPNMAFLKQFPESERFNVVRTLPMRATTIDSLGLGNVDFLKLDTQGAELAILQGGGATLRQLIGLEVEVEFSPMYEGQPLFADVDKFVRERLGLELWDIRRTYWKHKDGLDNSTTKGRLIFGDALYLRPMSQVDDEKAIMLALSAVAYGFLDYAQAIVRSRAFPAQVERALSGMIEKRSFRPLRNGSWPLFVLLDALAKAFRPTHNRWVAGGETLGSRRRGWFWS